MPRDARLIRWGIGIITPEMRGRSAEVRWGI